MKNVKTVEGRELKVGDRVKIINAGMGAYGANGATGVVVDYNSIPTMEKVSGLARYQCGVIIKLDKRIGDYKNLYWRTSVFGEYEVEIRKYHKEMDVMVKDKQTKVVIGDRVGVSNCNSDEDKFNEAYGVILAVARAYKLDNKKFQALVDALYDDVKTLKHYNSEEIIEELKTRIHR